MIEIPDSAREAIIADLTLARDLEALRMNKYEDPRTIRIASKIVAKRKGEAPFLTLEPDWFLEIDKTSWKTKMEQLQTTLGEDNYSVKSIVHLCKRAVTRLRGVLEHGMKSNNEYRNLVVIAGVTLEVDYYFDPYWKTTATHILTHGIITKYDRQGVPQYKSIIRGQCTIDPYNRAKGPQTIKPLQDMA